MLCLPFFINIKLNDMFSLNNYVDSIDDIPSEWILEYYLDLPEKLTGQHVRIPSLFNSADRTPSMHFHYFGNTNRYVFKCFSTGISGTPTALMMRLWQVDFKTASQTIMNDYKSFTKDGKMIEKKSFVVSSWVLSDYYIREWTKDDAKYWLQYNIGSKLLEKYNVIPLRSYTMTKYIGDVKTDEEFTMATKFVYVYTTVNNEMYKIYQPMKRDRKFMKLLDYVQGWDQLEEKRYLVITSSLKDCMSIKSIPKLDIDVIAPDSENTKLSDELIDSLKNKYEAVVTYMDSDTAGIESMQYYLQKHNIPFCYVSLEKDFSDIVKVHGISKAAYTLIPILDKAIAKYKELNIEYFDNSDLVY